jgi:hypothetical protein
MLLVLEAGVSMILDVQGAALFALLSLAVSGGTKTASLGRHGAGGASYSSLSLHQHCKRNFLESGARPRQEIYGWSKRPVAQGQASGALSTIQPGTASSEISFQIVFFRNTFERLVDAFDPVNRHAILRRHQPNDLASQNRRGMAGATPREGGCLTNFELMHDRLQLAP